MYMVPQSTPAASAATTPRVECPAGAWVDEATASSVAPANISAPPPTTPSQRARPAARSSPKKTTPHAMPSRLLAFQSGKAMLSPMSRMANAVSVLATAHKPPASTDHTSKWGAWRISAPTADVPRNRAGTLQRARNTPSTIVSEITMGEMPSDTILVGASAAPSQAPAVTPLSTPTRCRRCRRGAATGSIAGPGVRTAARRPAPRTGRRAPSWRGAGGAAALVGAPAPPRQLADFRAGVTPKVSRIGANPGRDECSRRDVEDELVVGKRIAPFQMPGAVRILGALDHEHAAPGRHGARERRAAALPVAPTGEQPATVCEGKHHAHRRSVAAPTVERRIRERGGRAPLPRHAAGAGPERRTQAVARDAARGGCVDPQRVLGGYPEAGRRSAARAL